MNMKVAPFPIPFTKTLVPSAVALLQQWQAKSPSPLSPAVYVKRPQQNAYIVGNVIILVVRVCAYDVH